MNERVRKLAEERAGVVRRMRTILEAAEGADSEHLTRAQERDYRQLVDQYNALTIKINGELGNRAAGSDTIFEYDSGQPAQMRAALEFAERVLDTPSGDSPTRPTPGGGPSLDARGDFRARRAAGEVIVLGREQRLADLFPEADEPAAVARSRQATGLIVRGMVTGDYGGVTPEMRAQLGGVDSLGGFLLSDPTSARVVDAARNQAVVFAAGAMTVPMDTETLSLARLKSEPQGTWRHENTPMVFGDLEFQRIRLVARTLLIGVKSSAELWQDVEGFGEIVERSLAEAVALELDRVALLGTGAAAEPRGLLNDPAIGVQPNVGTPADYDDISVGIQGVRNANGEPNALIWSPRTAGSYARLKDTTNQPLRQPDDVAALTKHATKQLPDNLGAGTNESVAVVGDMTKLLVGIRLGFTLEVSRDAAGGSSSAFRDYQVWIRAALRADVALEQPTHFSKLPAITA